MTGDLSQNDGMEHEAGHHQHVAGSGTAEGFSREGSREGSDGDGRGPKDAAHALLGGLAASGANGVSGMVDDCRSGGEGQEDPDSDSDRKGHGEDQTLLGGMGNLLTRARRGVNSYFSALARQQKEIARETRRTQSSNFDFLVGAEEGVGLLALDGAVDGDSGGHNGKGEASTNGGPIHRSKSAVFVPSRPAAQEASASSSTALDAAVLGAGGAPKASEFSYAAGSRAEALQGETSMQRGGQSRLTKGDFAPRLYRDDKQGAGEHSAQDEDRERPRPQEKGRGFLWSARAAGKPRKVNSMPQLKDCDRGESDWKMGSDHWADHGFKVLGVEIGHLPEHQQVALLAGGVFSFLLIYGYMQEYLVVKVFEKKLGLFMTFLQFFGYAACAALRRGIHRETGRKAPMRAYFGLGLLQAVMQGLTNVSMMYLNYPAKVLFKSSRMVPIMCFGVVWQGRKYSLRDCSVVFLIVVGLATFMNAETRSSAATDTPCSLLGVACISLALVIDAANINLQEEVMNRYASCQDELIMFSYLCGTVYVAVFCLFSGELVSGLVFLHGEGLRAMGAVMLYCGAGFLGGSCAVALTKRFGALHSAITTTARKAVTLMLSFVYFKKALTPQHIVGASVFMIGLMGKIFGKQSKSSGRAPSVNNSPIDTPFVYRKHLRDDGDESDQYASSSSAALLPGGSGGGGTCTGGGGGGGRGVNGITNSSVGQEDSPTTLASNSGGHPVRHRGMPKVGGVALRSGSEMDGGGRAGSGKSSGGRWVRQKQISPPRSPLRNRIASPPVTGLGYMIA